ncbi:hypothetical protein GDN83_08545 [Gordonia jinghuaiqii]|uniref:Uncharacterized protein n=1 Tax=Gordonia jinghuaiqii TaxID=2758710 RepID=A0A7D7QR03_9ACTN|nr:hypothetical protein [Gordonia jinghuaiqii]MCR5977786.1 hypothetical protein [Gordonia jinghuaiqii]QMT02446.1 hypothetical protein H1R19_04615 [Gordonia jinghuaiqii]
MYNINRLLAALPAICEADRSMSAKLSRFSPEQAGTYLGWRFIRDHGEGKVRYPDDPTEQLRLIADTVNRERERVCALRDDVGWHGPLSNPELTLGSLVNQIKSADEQHVDQAHELLDSLVAVAMTSDDTWIDNATRAVESAADRVSRLEGKGSGTPLSANAREAYRYVTRELGQFEDRRWQTIVDTDQILSGEFDELASLARQLGPPKPPAEYLDRQILPPGTRSAFQQIKADEETRRLRRPRPVAYDEDRLSVLEMVQSKMTGVVGLQFRLIRPDPSLKARDTLSGALSDYHVLVIMSGGSEHAVAVSPMAGQDAIYIVRADVSKESWQDVLTGTKQRARALKAKSLRVTGEQGWKHEQAAAKVVAYLTCDAYSFRTSSPVYHEGRWSVGFY